MRNAPILQSGPTTGNINGAPIPANQLFAASVLATFSENTAAGTIKLQASNDAPIAGQQAPFAPVNWVDIPNATAAVTAGASVLVPMTQLAYQWIRVVFARTGGAGTSNFYINVQGI